MTTLSATADVSLHGHSLSLRDYTELLKPRVMTLVVFSAMAGLLLAPGELHPFMQLMVILSIALGSGAAGMINMWYDRDIDGRMERTKHRAIPAGKVAAEDVLVAALFLSVFSVMMLGFAANWQAAGLLGFAIFFYGVIYTMWLKRHTVHNTVIGGAAGAFPPVIGWWAMSGNITAFEPWILFAIIFFWTPPHFWALALRRNADYRTVNIPMLPVISGEKTTKRHIVIYSFILAIVSMLPFALEMSSIVYAFSATALNGIFLYYALMLQRSPAEQYDMKLFGYSILYLFLILAMMLVDHAYLSIR